MLNTVGRSLERALTGQSCYRATFTDFAEAPIIDNTVQARIILDELKSTLSQHFDIMIRWPVLLELEKPPPSDWKGSFYQAQANLGRYTPWEMGPQKAHQIMITPGLPRQRFRGVLGHELVHAYQREAEILVGNRALREGMARWVEYSLLKDTDPEEAQKIARIKHYTFGRAVRIILEYEEKHGRAATLTWLHQIQE